MGGNQLVKFKIALKHFNHTNRHQQKIMKTRLNYLNQKMRNCRKLIAPKIPRGKAVN